jgi:glycine/D-amino acid oxidase-like deaminating enzyme
MAREYDVIVIGAGHNGLICGAYLAKAGKKVLILERRHVLGGACVTEEVRPGSEGTGRVEVLLAGRPAGHGKGQAADLAGAHREVLSRARVAVAPVPMGRRTRGKGVPERARRPEGETDG